MKSCRVRCVLMAVLGLMCVGASARHAEAQVAESFDALTPPTIPLGWDATLAQGTAGRWVTVTNQMFSAPNSIAALGMVNATDSVLTLPPIVSAGVVRLDFRRRYQTSPLSDGMVLESSINGGAFQNLGDGAWSLNGYTGTIPTTAANSIAGQRAFTGSATTWTQSIAVIPAPAGQSVSVRFRMVTEAGASAGVWLDDVVLSTSAEEYGACCNTATASCTVQPTGSCAAPMIYAANQTCQAAPCPAPANDSCEGALNINTESAGVWPYVSGPTLVAAATNDARDVECDANDGALIGGLWWTYTTGPSAQRLTLSETGAQDVVMSVWAGTCTAFTPVICSDGVNDGFSVNLAENTAYQICVSKRTGAYSAGNTVTLTVASAPINLVTPINDTCSGAVDYDLLGLPTGAVNALAQVDYASATTDQINVSCENHMGLQQGVWYTHMTGGLSEQVTLGESTAENCRFTLLSGACGTPVIEGCSEGGAGTTEAAAFTLAANTRYFFVFSKSDANNAPQGGSAIPTLITPTVRIDVLPAPPSNDDCANATIIASLPYAAPAPVLNAGAGNDPLANPYCDSASFTSGASKGIWYAYTTGATPIAIQAAETTPQDSILSFWASTGPCAGLVELECNNIEANSAGYVVWLPAQTTVYIVISRLSAALPALADGYALRVDPVAQPANDTCASATAIPISSPSWTATVDARGANPDAPLPCNTMSTDDLRGGVWFTFTVPAGIDDLNVVFSETAPAVNTVVAVYEGQSCEVLSPVACSLAETGNLFVARAGHSYFIVCGMEGASKKRQPQASYVFSATFTPATGACCTAGVCAPVVLSTACRGTDQAWLGAGSTCVPAPAYAYAGPVLSIPTFNTTGVSNTIAVSGFAGTVSSVRLSLGINHTNAGAVVVRLKGPNNVTVDLMARPGATTGCLPLTTSSAGTGNDLAGVYVFDDGASQTLAAAALASVVVPPGSYRPSTCNDVPTSLSAAFNGTDPNGNWTLTVIDTYLQTAGSLTSWGLTFNGSPSSCETAGACCNASSCAMAVNAAACAGDPSNFKGAGSSCGATTCGISMASCCRGTTCNPVATGTCTGVIAGSDSLIVDSCGTGNAFTSCCFADYNHDGTQSIDDLFLYFNAYFTGSPMADFGGTGTSQPTIDDLFLYINAYFGTCS